ncbi:putative disease resistance protein RGA4, partial [Mucuna pruriens]
MLWEALGFLPPPPKESGRIKDVGNHLLRVLLSRSFLTDFLDLTSDCIFKLHDLVCDLAVYVAQDEFQIIYPRGPKIYEHTQHLRFMENNLFSQALLPSVSMCKYLRVLDLPYSIGLLKHLRYIGLEELPEWLSALICLKQLGIIFCPKLLSLPDSMHHVTHLQLLSIIGCSELCKTYPPE